MLDHVDLVSFRGKEKLLENSLRQRFRPGLRIYLLRLARGDADGSIQKQLTRFLGTAAFDPELPLIAGRGAFVPVSDDPGEPALGSYATSDAARESAETHFAVGSDPGRVQVSLVLQGKDEPAFYCWLEERLETTLDAPSAGYTHGTGGPGG